MPYVRASGDNDRWKLALPESVRREQPAIFLRRGAFLIICNLEKRPNGLTDAESADVESYKQSACDHAAMLTGEAHWIFHHRKPVEILPVPVADWVKAMMSRSFTTTVRLPVAARQ